MAQRIRYDEALARRICRRLAEGETLMAICRGKGMPARRTVYDWLEAHAAFQARYRAAREQQLETWAEEIVELADTLAAEPDREQLARTKLRIEVRQWLLQRLAGRSEAEPASGAGRQRRPVVIQVVTGIARPGDRAVALPAPKDSAPPATELEDGNSEEE